VLAEPEAASVEEPSDTAPLAVTPEAGRSEACPTEAEAPAPGSGHWLLSLFTPASTDAVDWRRGNYTILARGGRIDSPAGAGELKKQLNMVAEGSVLHTTAAPCGAALDVAPDGFAHPVFRAGFALAIPLPGKPEVS